MIGVSSRDPVTHFSRYCRNKALVIADAMGDGWVCEEAASRTLGLRWVGVWPRMCLQGLGLNSRVL